jgi:hypothetical protein
MSIRLHITLLQKSVTMQTSSLFRNYKVENELGDLEGIGTYSPEASHTNSRKKRGLPGSYTRQLILTNLQLNQKVDSFRRSRELLVPELQSICSRFECLQRRNFFVALGGILTVSGLCPQSPRVCSCLSHFDEGFCTS